MLLLQILLFKSLDGLLEFFDLRRCLIGFDAKRVHFLNTGISIGAGEVLYEQVADMMSGRGFFPPNGGVTLEEELTSLMRSMMREICV